MIFLFLLSSKKIYIVSTLVCVWVHDIPTSCWSVFSSVYSYLKYEFIVFNLNFVVFIFQYENPWTIPNMLSMTRIGLAPVLGYLIIEEDFNIALGVFALAGLTDLVSCKGTPLVLLPF